MGIASVIGNFLAVYALSSFYTFFIVLGSMFNFLRKGKAIFYVKPRPSPPPCLTDPAYGRHNFIKLKDVKLHYVEAGDNRKPLMLFVHGFPEFWFSWRHQIKEFQNDYWTVAVDMRGYGDSDKPSGRKNYTMDKLTTDIVQLIEALGRSSCILVAHDWGGIVAYSVATSAPQLVDRLIIMNSPHPNIFFKHVRSSVRQFFKSWYIFFFQMPFIPEIIMRLEDINSINKMFLSHPRAREVFCDHDIEAYKYAFGNKGDFTGPINYYRNRLAKVFGEIVEMPKIKVPSIIIWGTDDKALATDLATQSSQQFDNCIVKLVKGGSHWVQQDSATAVNQHMRSFLQEYQKSLLIMAKENSESLVERVFSSMTKMPGVTPVISLYKANSWVAGLNRKLL